MKFYIKDEPYTAKSLNPTIPKLFSMLHYAYNQDGCDTRQGVKIGEMLIPHSFSKNT